jgi:hypothetical protein
MAPAVGGAEGGAPVSVIAVTVGEALEYVFFPETTTNALTRYE